MAICSTFVEIPLAAAGDFNKDFRLPATVINPNGSEYSDYEILFEKSSNNFKLFQKVAPPPTTGRFPKRQKAVVYQTTPIDTMPFLNLKVYTDFLDKTRYDGFSNDYTEVKNNLFWQNIYDVKKRNLPRKVGTEETTKSILSVPCVRCGYVFRLSQITIEHQRPKSNNTFAARIKTFRAMGLTVEGARGYKGKHIFDIVTNNALLDTAKGVYASVSPMLDDRGQRYTMSYKGIIVYSVLDYYVGSSAITQACVHNLCNLSPQCNRCNSSGNNSWRFER